MSRVPTALDLFAGGGGLSTGLTNAGFDVVAAVERDPCLAAIHEANHPATHHFSGAAGDVNLITGPQVMDATGLSRGDLDLISAGPPCQGFSLQGKRQPADIRNQLWQQVVRLTRSLRPRRVLIENVPGLLSLEGGAFHQAITGTLEKSGYGVDTWQLNAADFGAPQSRQRLFMVATRNGEAAPEEPVPACVKVSTWGAIHDLPKLNRDPEAAIGSVATRYARAARTDYARALRADDEAVTYCEATVHGESILGKIKPLRWGDRDPSSRHRRLHPQRPAYTLLAGSKTITACRPIHPYQDRVITVREGARLAGYPDNYQFGSRMSTSWVAIGNSVPPPLGRAVGGAIVRSL